MLSKHHLGFIRGIIRGITRSRNIVVVGGVHWAGGGHWAGTFFPNFWHTHATGFSIIVQAGAAMLSRRWHLLSLFFLVTIVTTKCILRFIWPRWDAANTLFHLRV